MKTFRRLVGVVVSVSSLGLAGGAIAGVGSTETLAVGQTLFLTGSPVGVFEQQCTAGTCLGAGGTNAAGTTFFSGYGAGTVAISAGGAGGAGGVGGLGGVVSSIFTGTGGNFSGTLTSQVLTNDAHNPYGLSGMDFVYQVWNNALTGGTASTPILHMSVSNWTLMPGALDPTSVGYIRDPVSGPISPGVPGPKPASDVFRTVADTIGWDFTATASGGAGDLTAGLHSPYLIVYTPATSFALDFVSVTDHGTASPLGYAPSAAIPEPETYAMMLAGLGLMGFVARRRRGAKTFA